MRKALPFLLLPALLLGAGPAKTTLRYARGGDAVRLDPADISDGESAKVTHQVFDTLVRFKPDGFELEPALAERWEHDADGLVWTFHLRAGVRFHDGTPLTSEVAKASLERLLDPARPYATSFAVIQAMETPEPLTLVVRLQRPYAPFLRNLAMFCAGIVPPSAADKDAFARAPVGTGPFRFVAWHPNEKLVLAANPDCWDGAPGVDGLVFLPVPDNAKRLKLLESGGADLMDGISLNDVAGIARNKALRLHVVRPGANLAYLAFNTTRKPLDDARVRQALALALDRQGMVDHLFAGRARLAESVIPEGFLGHDQSFHYPARDLVKAKALLKEAGLPDGFETTLWVMPNPRPYLPEPKRIAQAVQANLAEIGVRAKIVSQDWGAYLDAVQGGKHDLCFMGWMTDNGDPDNFAFVLLDKDNATPGAASNVSFYKDEAVHGWLLEAQATPDEAKRAALYAKVMEKVREACPLVPLASTDGLAATRAGVEGFRLHPVGIPLLNRVTLR